MTLRQLAVGAMLLGCLACVPTLADDPPDDHLWSTAPDAIVPSVREQMGPRALTRDERSVSFRLWSGCSGVFTPKTGTLADFAFTVNGHSIAPCAGGELSLEVEGKPYSIGPGAGLPVHLESFDPDGDWFAARWSASAGGRELHWTIRAQPVRKSIVVEVGFPGGVVSALRLGHAEGVPNARAIEVPYLAYDWNQSPNVLYTSAAGGLYLAAWPDWHVSEGSVLYAPRPQVVGEAGHAYQGGILYNREPDGTREDLHERIVLCLSPRFDEVLPNIPRPEIGAGDVPTGSLWCNAGAMSPEMLRRCRAYGVDHALASERDVWPAPRVNGKFQTTAGYWLYAGLVDGNYAQMAGPAPWKRAPLVDFDLLRIHPLETDLGMGDPGMFFKDSPDWSAGRSRTSPWLDRFIASTLAFGHVGYLTSEWGLDGTLKSYFLVQPVQREYALVPVEAIRYRGDSGLVDTSEALATGAMERHRQVYVKYQSGLEVWANLSFDEDWNFLTGGGPMRLPPAGWVAELPGKLRSYSATAGGGRVDLLEAPDVTHVDTRGHYAKVGPVRTRGAVAIKRDGEGAWVIPALEASPLEFAPEALGLPAGSWLTAEGVAEDGSEVGRATVTRSPDGVLIEPVAGAIKYRVRAEALSEPTSIALTPDGDSRDLVRGDTRTVRVSVRNRTGGPWRGTLRLEGDGVVGDASLEIGPIPAGGVGEADVAVALADDAATGAFVRLTAVVGDAIPCVCVFRAAEPVALRGEAS